jgi:Ca2+-binding EF-hand superfamily protein
MFSTGLLLAVVAAQASAAGVDEIFRAQDTNGDNALSVEEARAAAPATFRSMDRGGKGYISADDIAAWTVAENGSDVAWPAQALAAVAKSTLEMWDGNHDGKVTEQEYSEAAVALMLLADADGDRRVTREELQRFRSEPVTP